MQKFTEKSAQSVVLWPDLLSCVCIYISYRKIWLKKTLNKNLQWIWIQELLFKRPMPYPLSFDYYIIFMKLFTKLKSYYINDSYGDMNHIFTADLLMDARTLSMLSWRHQPERMADAISVLVTLGAASVIVLRKCAVVIFVDKCTVVFIE